MLHLLQSSDVLSGPLASVPMYACILWLPWGVLKGVINFICISYPSRTDEKWHSQLVLEGWPQKLEPLDWCV